MIYKIENFKINTSLREVYLNDEKQNLEPKVYDLIIFLIENSNKAISKDELQDNVWPNLEVSETAITRAIMKARKVLNDGENTQSYIQTVHGHGYKFIANIEVETESNLSQPINVDSNNTINHSNHSNDSSNNSAFSIFLVATLISIIAIGFLYLTESSSIDSDDKLAILPIINETNDEEYSWTSIGLMSLVSQIIQSKNSIQVVSDADSVSESKNFSNLSLKLSEQQVDEIKQNLEVTHFVLAALTKIKDQSYQLSYTVYHPKGSYANILLQGENPTNLAQNMAQKISQILPGNSLSITYDVISADVFTNELYARGMSFQIEGFADKARNYFEIAIEQDPELFAPRLELAITKRKQGDYLGSVKDLEQLAQNIQRFSKDPVSEIQVYNSLGIGYYRLNDNENAVLSYTRAYELALELNHLKYQSTAATNIGIVYKNEKLYEKASVWVAKAITADKVFSDNASANGLYLLGQIERDMGNISKAENLFLQAKQLFLKDNYLREASSVNSAYSRLLIKKGEYQKSLKVLDESYLMKQKLNDSIGVADSKLSFITLYLKQGEYSKARLALEEANNYIVENQVVPRYGYTIKEDIFIDFNQGLYQQVLDKINNLSDEIESVTLEMMAMKSQQKLGNQTVIKQWLEENTELKSGTNNNLRLYWMDLENYYLEDYGTPEQLKISYQDRINLSKSLGHYATSAETLIKLTYVYIQQQQLDQAKNTLNELKLFDLDWWQIDLLEALLEFNLNNQQMAKELAIKAKQNASESWSDKDEENYQLILSN